MIPTSIRYPVGIAMTAVIEQPLRRAPFASEITPVDESGDEAAIVIAKGEGRGRGARAGSSATGPTSFASSERATVLSPSFPPF